MDCFPRKWRVWETREFYGLRKHLDFPPRGKIYLKPFFASKDVLGKAKNFACLREGCGAAGLNLVVIVTTIVHAEHPPPLPSVCHFLDAAVLLTVGSFLLAVKLFYLQLCLGALLLTITVGALLLTIGAFLLTSEAFLLTVGKCFYWVPQWTVGRKAQFDAKGSIEPCLWFWDPSH